MEEEMYVCILCGSHAAIMVGIAFGMSGDDYPLCNWCIKTKTIQDLFLAVEAMREGLDVVKL